MNKDYREKRGGDIESEELWRNRISKILKSVTIKRLLKSVTALQGPLFKVNHYCIEIDITYKCNLKCLNCNRSCRQAPSDESMSLEQIGKFVDESIRRRKKWGRIRIVGGEPTLCPHFFDIMEQILLYKKDFSPATRIYLVTNGVGKVVNDVLSQIPRRIEIINTAKKSPVNKFYPFNVAPIDDAMYKGVDYSNACWIPYACGIGLTSYGYYPCAVGGAIDRIFGFDIGRKRIPATNDLMINELRVLCSYCGIFKSSIKDEKITKQMMSSTWKKAYQKYKTDKPSLSLY